MKNIILFLNLLVCSSVFAQVSFVAKSSRDKMGINERVKIEFTVNHDGDNFRAPSFNNFRKIAGPNQSVQSTWVNGKSSFSKTYTYFLQPTKKGKLEVGQAEIEVDGQVYKTSPIPIEVTSAVDNPGDGTGNQIDLSDAIHLVAEVSNYKPYLNEGISVVYKLYVSPTTNVRNWQSLDEPKYNGFWSQNIDLKRQEVKEGTYGGNPYRYVELRRTVLYPQKTGKLVIEPLSLDISVEVPSNKRDFFGRRLYDIAQKTVSAKSKTVDVKSLPQEGKPIDFSGAVGEFELNVKTNKTELLATESLNYDVIISGKGNLSLMNMPKPKFPSAIESYDPEHTENVKTSVSGMYGEVKDKYTLVPNTPGQFKINPLSFTYFDPRAEAYKTINSKAISLDVKANPNVATTSTNSTDTVQMNEQNKNYVSDITQLNFIRPETNLKSIESTPFFKSTLFWILVGVFTLMIPFLLVFRKSGLFQTDSKNKTNKHLDRLAKKYLSEAKSSIGQPEIFYTNLELALHKFLKAKLGIKTHELAKENLKIRLQDKSVDKADLKAMMSMIEKCELARYASAESHSMEEDYKKSSVLISKIDKQI
ncbi:BatD family protein [Psychroflexus halocasei]|uniref:Oxygen tolerance n=1 Tax=Psychroflexus halocasei TaxID=908615 RepID=A0A1H3VVI0_9FLAO|nr:BatD family protein [Psychroflexus halocasei]SDZ78855.1 Oxygen tolerance [Psychroflexus halocasei]